MAGHSYDLVIVGAGSGNMLPTKELAGWRIALAESDRFGGTCLNRGCIPSKMLVHTADVAQEVRHAGRFGIAARWAGADWPAIRDRVFGRIDPLHEQAVAYRRAHGVDVFLGEARFVAPKVLQVGGDEIRAERFVLAAGSRPHIPPVNGLAGVPYLTSDTVMRLRRLPKSMVVLGGGYIAAEMSHIFGSLGTRVTIITRGEHLLSRHDADIRARFTELYRQRFDLRLGTTARRADKTRKGIRLDLSTPSGAQSAEGEVLLVATGRVPNSDRLDVAAAGIETDEHGHPPHRRHLSDERAGDLGAGRPGQPLPAQAHGQRRGTAGPPQPAAPRRTAQGAIHGGAVRGLRGPAGRLGGGDRAGPASRRAGLCRRHPPLQRHRLRLGWRTPPASSRSSPTPPPGLLLGAHIIGPQASTLIQPLIQAMCLGNTVDEVASGVLYIHPALTEAVEQALLDL